jgi:hypothetical protein
MMLILSCVWQIVCGMLDGHPELCADVERLVQPPDMNQQRAELRRLDEDIRKGQQPQQPPGPSAVEGADTREWEKAIVGRSLRSHQTQGSCSIRRLSYKVMPLPCCTVLSWAVASIRRDSIPVQQVSTCIDANKH